MTYDPADRALCESVEHEANLTREAYATGQREVIDDALDRVSAARRLVSNGMYDLMFGEDPSS